MSKIIRFIPLVLFFILALLLYRGLFLNPKELPSVLVGRAVPEFNLTTLKDADQLVSTKDLRGKIVLLNVWATWCPTCNYEHPYLLRLAKTGRIALYGINYNDDRVAAQAWIKKYGDPYVFSIFDDQGKLGLDLGVYGAPETFVIDSKGVIRMRFAGALDGNTWQKKFEPLILKLEQELALENAQELKQELAEQ